MAPKEVGGSFTGRHPNGYSYYKGMLVWHPAAAMPMLHFSK